MGHTLVSDGLRNCCNLKTRPVCLFTPQQTMAAGSANVDLFALLANKEVDLSKEKLSNKEIVEIAEALKNKECVVQTLDIRSA